MPEVPARKVIRKEVRFDQYTERVVEALMATGDFANEADMIRTAIQRMYSEYAAHQFPLVLQSETRTMSIDTGSVAKPGEQKSVTATRWKSKKSKAASKPEEEESVEAI